MTIKEYNEKKCKLDLRFPKNESKIRSFVLYDPSRHCHMQLLYNQKDKNESKIRSFVLYDPSRHCHMQLLYNQKDMQSQQCPMTIFSQLVKIGKLNKMEDAENCKEEEVFLELHHQFQILFN